MISKCFSNSSMQLMNKSNFCPRLLFNSIRRQTQIPTLQLNWRLIRCEVLHAFSIGVKLTNWQIASVLIFNWKSFRKSPSDAQQHLPAPRKRFPYDETIYPKWKSSTPTQALTPVARDAWIIRTNVYLSIKWTSVNLYLSRWTSWIVWNGFRLDVGF